MDPSALSNSIAALRSSIKDLESRSSSLESLLYFFVALVVIGVVLEVGFVAWEYRGDLEEYHRGTIRSPQDPNKWKLFIELLGAVLVAIGVTGELGVDVKSGTIQTDLRTKNGELVQLLEGVSSAALERAAELEAQIQPRALTKKQRDDIGAICSMLGQRRIDVFVTPGDLEGARLGGQIRASLSHCIGTFTYFGHTPDDNIEGIQVAGPKSESLILGAIS